MSSPAETWPANLNKNFLHWQTSLEKQTWILAKTSNCWLGLRSILLWAIFLFLGLTFVVVIDCVCVWVSVCLCVWMYVCVFVLFVYVYVCLCVCMPLCMCAYVYVYMCVCISMCSYICVQVTYSPRYQYIIGNFMFSLTMNLMNSSTPLNFYVKEYSQVIQTS